MFPRWTFDGLHICCSKYCSGIEVSSDAGFFNVVAVMLWLYNYCVNKRLSGAAFLSYLCFEMTVLSSFGADPSSPICTLFNSRLDKQDPHTNPDLNAMNIDEYTHCIWSRILILVIHFFYQVCSVVSTCASKGRCCIQHVFHLSEALTSVSVA